MNLLIISVLKKDAWLEFVSKLIYLFPPIHGRGEVLVWRALPLVKTLAAKFERSIHKGGLTMADTTLSSFTAFEPKLHQPESTRARPRKWSGRMTLSFVLATSATLWSGIFFAVWSLV